MKVCLPLTITLTTFEKFQQSLVYFDAIIFTSLKFGADEDFQGSNF